MAVPVAALAGRLASLPEGVSIARDRIEVRFCGAQEAVARLYALAQVLTNDYERFETLVGRGRGVGMSEALMPAYSGPPVTRRGETAAIVLPQLIVAAGPVAVERFLEFFAARIANERTRAGVRAGRGAVSGVV